MKKLVILLLCFLLFTENTFSGEIKENTPEKPTIIPRISWGANEMYASLDSTYWKNILKAREEITPAYKTEAKKKKEKEDRERTNAYLNENFSDDYKINDTVYSDENGKLAWPIKHADTFKAIVIHHTHSEYTSSLEGVRQIYRYHTLNRQWGDIGYNYIIGYDGEIFEGRKGGDYTVAAHSKWNNDSALGIAVMGNYMSQGINEKQYNSLDILIKYNTWKYGIDLSKKHYYHMNCKGNKCDTFPIETYLDHTLVGHRDTGHTSCPGDKLYEQIQKLREDNINYTSGFTTKSLSGIEKTTKQKDTYSHTHEIQKYFHLLRKVSDKDLDIFLNKINLLLSDSNIENTRKRKLQILKIAIILSKNKNGQ